MNARRAGPTVAVAVCTYHRNDLLAALLEALRVSAARLGGRAAVGAVVVDDSVDGRARSVADQFQGQFELGLTYRSSASQNISRARNMALEAAIDLAGWTAMTDDDCEPAPEWLEALLDAQQRTSADAVTGPMVRRAPPDAPRWLSTEPFLDLGLGLPEDGAEVGSGATHNSMISNRWLMDHPTVRFEPSLGVIGGEDMVFYRAAKAAGLRIHFARYAIVYEKLPPERTTLGYQLRKFFWHGNSSYVTMVDSGVRPARVFVHAINNMRRALARPVARGLSGHPPHLRYCLASTLHSLGMMLGVVGLRVRHR